MKTSIINMFLRSYGTYLHDATDVCDLALFLPTWNIIIFIAIKQKKTRKQFEREWKLCQRRKKQPYGKQKYLESVTSFKRVPFHFGSLFYHCFFYFVLFYLKLGMLTFLKLKNVRREHEAWKNEKRNNLF